MFKVDINKKLDLSQPIEEEINLPPLPEEFGDTIRLPDLPTMPKETTEQTLLSIQKTLDEQAKAAEQREARLEAVCSDLAASRDAAYDKVLDGILLDIVSMKEELNGHVDDFSELTGLLISEAGSNPLLKTNAARCRELLKILRGMEASLENILYKNNVEAFAGTEYDPETQRIASSRTADFAAAEPKKYIETVKSGYTRDGRVIRKQLVDVIQVESYESFEILDVLRDVIPQRRTDLMRLAEEDL